MAQFSNKPELTIPTIDAPVSSSRSVGADFKPPPLAGSGRILLITVTNIQFPVTVAAVYDAFSRCGSVAKVVTFNKNGREQALVQFARADEAATAVERLQGRSMYAGGNVLSIQYSNLPDVTIKCNSERAHNFAGPRRAQRGGVQATEALGCELGAGRGESAGGRSGSGATAQGG
jgi:hypothetical protein